MKLKKIFSIILLAVAALSFQSCSDSDDSATAKVMKLFQGNTEVTELNFSLGASSQMLGVFSDADWEASLSEESWCTISNHAGFVDGDSIQYIKISVAKNPESARSVVLTVRAGGTSRTVTINQNGTETDPDDPFISAFTFVEDLKMGYNLGNTLDASQEVNKYDWFTPSGPGDWQTYETCWGQPVTTQEMIDAIAAKGFNIIRVPVTWFPHMDTNGNVNEEWMNRVEQVVKYVLNTGSYCILNVQHDTGAKGDREDNIAWISTAADEYATTSPLFKKLWTQIANRFKSYDDKLLFEGMNEVLNKERSFGTDYASYSADDWATLNKLLQDFVDAVRATGGNNEYRNLLIATVGSTSASAAISQLQCPTDKHPNHIVGSVHCYDPYWFCNDGSGSGDNIYWINYFDSDCQTEIDDIFNRVDAHFLGKLGIPYIFGEFGAIGSHPEMAERVKYAQYMAKKFKEYGTTGLWWMGLYDRQKGEWNESEIVDALMK